MGNRRAGLTTRFSGAPQDATEYGCWAGHMPLELTRHFPGPFESATMLRDPVARTVSDYYHCRQNPANPAHEVARNLSLVEFVEQGYGLTHNCYAR